MTTTAGDAAPSTFDALGVLTPEVVLTELRTLREDFTRFMLQYKFGMDEIITKVRILQEEFQTVHSYNPIEHISGRLKSPDSLLAKMRKLDCAPTFESISSQITDIAGVRVVCSFVPDVFRVLDILSDHQDVEVLQVKDYVSTPKPNGYRSLHAIVRIPVYLSDGVVHTNVEIQIRTIAMDFWAALEHKIHYKYSADVPEPLLADLREAAMTAARLDTDMERLHREIRGVHHDGPGESSVDNDMELSETAAVEFLRQRLQDGSVSPAAARESTPPLRLAAEPPQAG